MSAVPPPPATAPAAGDVQAVVTVPTGFGVLASTMMLIPLLILLVFHLGAGYLSYQKYGNLGWAFLNFIFAYFYYPYYAFFLAKDPGPSMGMVGGKAGGIGKLLKAVFGK
jgi:hypothetical protein